MSHSRIEPSNEQESIIDDFLSSLKSGYAEFEEKKFLLAYSEIIKREVAACNYLQKITADINSIKNKKRLKKIVDLKGKLIEKENQITKLQKIADREKSNAKLVEIDTLVTELENGVKALDDYIQNEQANPPSISMHKPPSVKVDLGNNVPNIQNYRRVKKIIRESINKEKGESGKKHHKSVSTDETMKASAHTHKRPKPKTRLLNSEFAPEVANISAVSHTESIASTSTLRSAIEAYNADLMAAKLIAADKNLGFMYDTLPELTETNIQSFEELELEKDKLRQAKATFNEAYKNQLRAARNIEETLSNELSDNDSSELDESSSDHDDSEDANEKIERKKPIELQYDPLKDEGIAYRKNDNVVDGFATAKHKAANQKPVNCLTKKNLLPKHVLDKLQLCEKTLSNLQTLQSEYKRYVTKIDGRENDDSYSMQLICNMEHELLRLFETLLTLQDNPTAKVFLSDKTARQLRNLSKYGSYIYGFNTDYIIQLARFASDNVFPVIKQRIKQQAVTAISNIPDNLYHLLANEKVQIDNDLALARYQFLFATLQKQSVNQAEVTLSPDRLSPLTMQTGAQLACLLRIGDIFKEMNYAAPAEQYSDELRKLIKENSTAGSPTLFRQPLTTPLLTYFEVTLKQEQGFALLQRIIQNLSRADMVLLLKELRDLQSHKTEDEWMALTNPQLNQLVSLISKRALALHHAVDMDFLNQRPANFSYTQIHSALQLSNDLNSYFTANIKASDYFINLIQALSDISQNKRAEATIRTQKLTNEFEKFSASYLFLKSQKDEIKKALEFLDRCMQSAALGVVPTKAGIHFSMV